MAKYFGLKFTMLNITEQIYAENLIWICINKFIMSTKSYYLYIKQFSHDGTNWINVQPLTYSVSGDTNDPMPLVVKEEHDAACGAMPPIYQWVDTEDTICVYEGHDYSREYLTIESESNNHEIYWQSLPHTALSQTTVPKTISASTDNGASWTEYTSTSGDNGTLIATLNTGDKVLLKGLNSAYGEYGAYYNRLKTNSRASNIKRCKVYGNIMSLLYGDNFSGQTALTEDSTFFYLFGGMNYSLTSAENLILPATTLTTNCYRWMFSSSFYLTTVPELPATTLADYCYQNMFSNCTSLTTAPTLPVATLANHCYDAMFAYCTNLTVAPELPATTLAEYCYHQMFDGCTSLVNAPALPATTLANRCYAAMFEGTSLTTPPELPATALANFCYAGMFENCASLTTAPVLSAATLVNGCYDNMFRDCTNLNYIKCMATNISSMGNLCTFGWVDGVAASGTFVKNANATWTTGVDGIPNNWTIQNA